MGAMASTSAGCSRAKIFKILIAVFCLLFLFEYIIDNRRTETLYTPSTNIKGVMPVQWPKRTKSRHCFEGVTEPPRDNPFNISSTSSNISNISSTKEVDLKTTIDKKDSVVFNVHNITQKSIISAELNSNYLENYKVTNRTPDSDNSETLPSTKSNVSTIASQNSDDSHQGYDSLSDSVREATVVPEVGCDVPCPAIPPGLNGPTEVNLTEITLKDIERNSLDIAPGGHYAPRHCKPNDKVAIIIPYRDREAHLAIFLNNMHPFLMKQQIEYQIYIVEQKGHGKFNRASLMNVGFVEALRQHDWDCFIFHDVDLLPLDDRNLYTCPSQPRHLSAAIDKFHFKLPYATIFGGVSALTTEQFQKVNGFSNSFWGWGGEDDDMANRINYHNYHISRYPMSIARYTMLSHEKENPNPKRYDVLMKGKRVFNTDGLNSLQYTLVETQVHQLYTLLLVELHPPS